MIEVHSILEFLSLACVGLLAGALMYCALVEVGARKRMQAQDKLANWKLAFPLAISIFKPLSQATTILLIVNGYVSADWLWYMSAFFTFLLTPVTLILIAPTNSKLQMADENTSDEDINNMINIWGARHNIRLMCAICAFFIAIYASII